MTERVKYAAGTAAAAVILAVLFFTYTLWNSSGILTMIPKPEGSRPYVLTETKEGSYPKALSALLTVARGTSIVTETLFESRFKFLDELGKMGADVRVIESTAIINGVEKLVGARVNATDLRAGAAMVIAALMAEGTTEISGVSYILRGYERFDEKLRRLGAQVERIVCPEDDF